MTKVLIANGARNIGLHTCLQLLKASQDIIVVDNLSNDKIEPLKHNKD